MSDRSNIWYLEDVNLFEYFCPITGGQEKYDKQPKRTYKKGEFIYFSDDNADRVFFVHSGAVKIAGYTEDGNEVIKAVLHPGEVFGELAVFGAERREDYAQAVEDTELCSLKREQTVDLMMEISPFQQFLNRLMGQRVIYTQKRLETLLFKDARSRIVDYILEQARKSKVPLSGLLKLRNYLTHQEIANYTGTSRQTVTTILNELREEGLIDFDRKTITVKDVGRLKMEEG